MGRGGGLFCHASMRIAGRSAKNTRRGSACDRAGVPPMSHAPSDALSWRHELVREACASQSFDALVVTSLPNILYLTNFTGSAAIVVLTAERLQFITDFRYVTAVTEATRTAWAC